MFGFGKKEEPTSLERLKKVETRLNLIEAEILDVATAQEIIRNKILRKIQYRKKELEGEESPKDLYNGILLPDK